MRPTQFSPPLSKGTKIFYFNEVFFYISVVVRNTEIINGEQKARHFIGVLLFKIAMGNTEFNKKRNIDIKGYVPLSNSLNEPIRKVDLSSKYPIDSNKVNCYKSFINDCIKANVKLYLVSSPYFFQSTGSDTSIALAKKIANEKNIDFIDFSKDGFFKSNSKLFDDTVHVNFAGSTIFCNRLIDTLISRDHYKTVKISNDIK